MRNGFLGSLLALLSIPALGSAQQPPLLEAPCFVPGLDASWQPPRPDTDDRPNIGPKGYAFYGQVDYLQWWTAKDHPVYALPPNAATGAATAVFGEGSDFGTLGRQGVDGTFGMWLDPQQHLAIEASSLWLSNRNWSWLGGTGDITLRDDFASRLWGAEVDGRYELYKGTFTHLDLLGGCRFLNLDEALDLAQRRLAEDVITSDRFGTRNYFFGGQIGLEADAHYGSWSLDVVGKVALGANDGAVLVSGTTVVAGRATQGGLLAGAALSGRYASTDFAAVPEVDIRLGYYLTNTIRVTLGYSFLFLSDVVRPAEQIDLLRPGAHGSLPANNADFWGQGINAGLEFRF
jgi:hypothetical protein